MTGSIIDEAHPTAAGSALLDSAGRVALDVPCLKCGYNLRTLAESGLCPECAYPVTKTVHSQYLWQSPALWLEGLVLGAQALAFCLGLALVFVALLAACTQVSSTAAETFGGVGGPIVAILVPFIGFAALLVLTVRAPNLLEQREPITARRLIRWSLGLVLFVVLGGIGLAASIAGVWLRFFAVAGLLTALWVLIVVPLAFWRHIAALMQRAPRPDLVRYAQRMFWVTAACELALAAAVVAEWMSQPFGGVEVLWWTIGVLLSVAAVAALILLVRVAYVLDSAYHTAQQLQRPGPGA